MKRILAVILTACLLLSCVPFAMAAPAKTGAAAKTLRLEATEGTVQMKNAAGRNLKLKGGTRLYNGYTLATQKASYAYVSLDETKAVKLGASTKSEVFRSGKKLELKVSSGELFFNVKVPLKSDESLTIRTSTMVTGVRGTCGWVEVLDRHTTRVSLLEGKLDITSTDPLTKTQRTTTIVGGQTATIVYHGDERRTSGVIVEDLTIQDLIEADVIHDENIILTDTGLTVEELEEADVPGSVSVEVKKDKDLQDRIEDTTDLSVPEIIKDAEQRQEEEEQQAEEKDKKIQEAVDQMGAEDTDPIFGTDDPQPESGSGTASTPTPAPVTYSLNVTHRATDDTFSTMSTTEIAEGSTYTAAPSDYDGYVFAYATGDPTTGIMDSDKSITFYYDPAITYQLGVDHRSTDGRMAMSSIEMIAEGSTYTASPATFDAYEFAYADGDPTTGIMDGDKFVIFYYNPKPIDLDDPTTLELQDALEKGYNPITITNANLTNVMNLAEAIENATGDLTSQVDINSGHVFTNATDSITIANNGYLTISNTTFTNNGTLLINGSGVLDVTESGSLTNEGTIQNNATIELHSDGVVNNNGTLTNNGSIGSGDIVSGTLNNTGTLTNNGSIGSSVILNTSGIMTVSGSVSVPSGKITVSGEFTVETGSVIEHIYVSSATKDTTVWINGGNVVGGIEIESDRTTDILMSGGSVDGGIAVVNTAGGSSISISGGTVTGANYGIIADSAPVNITVSNSGVVSGGLIGVRLGSTGSVSASLGGTIQGGSNTATGEVFGVYVSGMDTTGVTVSVDNVSTISATCGTGGTAYAIGNYYGDGAGTPNPATISIGGMTHENTGHPVGVTTRDVVDSNVFGTTADLYFEYGMED